MKLWHKIIYGSLLLISIRLIFISQFSVTFSRDSIHFAPNLNVDSIFQTSSEILPTTSYESSIERMNSDKLVESISEQHSSSVLPPVIEKVQPEVSYMTSQSMSSNHGEAATPPVTPPVTASKSTASHRVMPSLSSKSIGTTDSGTCDVEREQDEVAWLLARRANYVTHDVTNSSDMAPLWKHSSVVTGPVRLSLTLFLDVSTIDVSVSK